MGSINFDYSSLFTYSSATVIAFTHIHAQRKKKKEEEEERRGGAMQTGKYIQTHKGWRKMHFTTAKAQKVSNKD